MREIEREREVFRQARSSLYSSYIVIIITTRREVEVVVMANTALHLLVWCITLVPGTHLVLREHRCLLRNFRVAYVIL